MCYLTRSRQDTILGSLFCFKLFENFQRHNLLLTMLTVVDYSSNREHYISSCVWLIKSETRENVLKRKANHLVIRPRRTATRDQLLKAGITLRHLGLAKNLWGTTTRKQQLKAESLRHLGLLSKLGIQDFWRVVLVFKVYACDKSLDSCLKALQSMMYVALVFNSLGANILSFCSYHVSSDIIKCI